MVDPRAGPARPGPATPTMLTVEMEAARHSAAALTIRAVGDHLKREIQG